MHNEQHYESFKKTKSICERVYDYCHKPSEEIVPSPPPLRRTRRVYKRKEVSTPKGEISITIYKKKEKHE
jgi:hypothetical protein